VVLLSRLENPIQVGTSWQLSWLIGKNQLL
jgi:hypothetical protein